MHRDRIESTLRPTLLRCAGCLGVLFGPWALGAGLTLLFRCLLSDAGLFLAVLLALAAVFALMAVIGIVWAGMANCAKKQQDTDHCALEFYRQARELLEEDRPNNEQDALQCLRVFRALLEETRPYWQHLDFLSRADGYWYLFMADSALAEKRYCEAIPHIGDVIYRMWLNDSPDSQRLCLGSADKKPVLDSAVLDGVSCMLDRRLGSDAYDQD